MKVINLITLTVFLLLIGCNGFEDTSEDLSFDQEEGAQLLDQNEDVVSEAIEELMEDESNDIDVPTGSEEFLDSENHNDGIYTGALVEDGFLSEEVPEEFLSNDEEEEGTELLSEGAYGGPKYRGNQPSWVPRGCYSIRNGVLRSKKKIHKYANHERRVKEMARSSTYTYTMAFKWWKRKMRKVWGGLFYRYSTANCNWRFCHRRPALWINRNTQKLSWQSVFTGRKIYTLDSKNRIQEGRWMYVAVTIRRLSFKKYQLLINLNGVITSKIVTRNNLEVVGGRGQMYTGLHRKSKGGGLQGKKQIFNPGADIAKFAFCPYALTPKEVAVWRKRAASGLLEGMERFRPRKYVPYKYRRPYGPKKPYNPKTPYKPKKPYKPTPKKPYKPTPKKPYKPTPKRPYKPTPKKPYKPTPKKPYKPTPKKPYKPTRKKPYKPVYKPKKPSKPVYKPKKGKYSPRRKPKRGKGYPRRGRRGKYGRRVRRRRGKGYPRRGRKGKYGRRVKRRRGRKGKYGRRVKRRRGRKGKYGRRVRRRRGKGYPRRGRRYGRRVRRRRGKKGKYGRRVRRRRGKGYPRRGRKGKYGRRVRRRRGRKGKYGRRVRRRRGKGYPRRGRKGKYGRRVRRRRGKGYPRRGRRYGRRQRRRYRGRGNDYEGTPRPVRRRKYDDYSDDIM